ncbi:tyrosine-type recombinase/integrase [Candidatus Harpocratesius sp.]
MEFPGESVFFAKYSKKTLATYKTRFKEFKTFITGLGLNSIHDVKKMHIDKYAREIIEPKQYRTETKNRHYSLIKQYFEFLYNNELISRPLKLDSSKSFSDHISQKILQRNALLLPEMFDLAKILDHAKKVNLRMYIYLALLFTNGMRPTELSSLRLDHIREMEAFIRKKTGPEKIKFTYLEVGTEENAKKTGQAFYFVHPKLLSSLEWNLYIKQIQYYQAPVYLFQTQHFPHSGKGFLNYDSISRNLKKYAKKLDLNIRITPHITRDVLSEWRMEQKCDYALREILINHSPSGTGGQYYMKKCKQLQYRYLYWLQYCPEEIIEIF